MSRNDAAMAATSASKLLPQRRLFDLISLLAMRADEAYQNLETLRLDDFMTG